MLKKIDILVKETGRSAYFISAWSWVINGIAIHKSLYMENRWNISHVATGLAYCTGIQREDVKRKYEEAKNIEVLDIPFHKLPACEALALATVATHKESNKKAQKINSEEWFDNIKPQAEHALGCD